MIFRIIPQAQREIAEAAKWYDREQLGLSEEFLLELETAVERIRQNPAGCPLWEHYHGAAEIRRSRLHRFPYVVIFVRSTDRIRVIAVSHTRRHPLYWLARLG